MNPLENFINGSFVPSSSEKYVSVWNPADETEVARVPLSTATDVDTAVEHALVASESWKEMTIKQRAAIMFRFHELMEVHKEELVDLIVRENGKNRAEALAEVAKGNETVEWACSLPQLAQGKTLEVSRGIHCTDSRTPLGVVGCIVPCNFPVMVPMWTIPISLTLGNCVICKPSEKVPLGLQRICSLFKEAGLPEGVFQVVHGAVDVVNRICTHPQISAVTFVGSSKVANIVAQQCHALNKRVLALGGAKNHLIALPDCDVGMASRDIVASFAGCCGQRCMAASALVLVGDCSDLLARVVDIAAKLQPGQQGGQVGPIIDRAARLRVKEYIDEAVTKDGAEILLDGRSWLNQSPGQWIGPTVLLHKSASDRAMQEEVFGPVLSVIKVDTWDEAIAIENANPYGNAACIYTEKGANAEWFTNRFRAGMLGVNIGIPVPREPFSFGGLYGTLSKYGDYDVTGDGAMEFFTNRRKVTSKWTASYSTSSSNSNGHTTKKMRVAAADSANFDGRM